MHLSVSPTRLEDRLEIDAHLSFHSPVPALFSQEMFDIWAGERMNERVRADNQEDHSPAFVII